MKDIKIKINKATRMVELSKNMIGNDGETLQNRFVFEFEDEFVNGQARLEYVINGETKYIFLDREGETYTTLVKSFLTKKGTIDMQLVISEGTNEENVPIFKSNMFYVYCNCSINAEIEQPEEYEEWIEIANTKLNQIDNVDIDIITDNDNTKVEITRKDGTKKSAIVGSTGGTDDYNNLSNKPKINGVELSGNKTLEDLGIKQYYTANDIKFADGDTFQDKYNSGELKGEKGDRGEQGIAGKDGYTPVKGKDYFTEADINEIVDDVLAKLPNSEEVSY